MKPPQVTTALLRLVGIYGVALGLLVPAAGTIFYFAFDRFLANAHATMASGIEWILCVTLPLGGVLLLLSGVLLLLSERLGRWIAGDDHAAEDGDQGRPGLSIRGLPARRAR